MPPGSCRVDGFACLDEVEMAQYAAGVIDRLHTRGALGAFGLPVNEDLASDWIQVDLLVGDDGAPQAVRLLPE